MKTTDSLPAPKDLVAIIKACGEAGVLQLDLGALKIRFQETFHGVSDTQSVMATAGHYENTLAPAEPEESNYIDPLEDPVAWQRAGMSFSTTAEGVADEAED
ncbi:MAG: hypothetical protein KF767_08880 [Bdellovibrionaceae bacterium]|nr:hypothetical protein [Pseudobdellovibrionaceae bacterium]